ncbi:AraC family transcriptional regulator [Saccharospirillum salsuginis]|uniref:Transcriptional regulator n=1 Tax=Saccharospirillum salsuginis TaxID=418750 RepID=A0A918N543_9GAMM|nr:AraC family transcriptional regulator [Saccharospirillum salsuginis]GGX40286.1 transcriptional regulator [Saccharospirillum salsuginis]
MTTNNDSLGRASVNALQQYLRLAEADGLDVDRLRAVAGLPGDLDGSTRSHVPGSAFQRLIHAMVEHTGDPILGLRSGDHVQPGSYNVLGHITMSCATLGEAIDCIAPYEKLVGDMGVTRVLAREDEISLVWSCAYTDPVVSPHMIDNVFASWIEYARWLACREPPAPLRVDLAHPSPGPDLEGEYVSRWKCPVHFDQPVNRIRCHRSLLDMPLRQPDPELRQTLEEHARARMESLSDPDSLAARVRHAIHRQLRQGVTRQDVVSEHLAMTPRTLQRRLGEEGLSYQRLLDEIRDELARDYLKNTGLTIQDIALRLGFSEVRSFHRRFKAWTGKTPGQYRELE